METKMSKIYLTITLVVVAAFIVLVVSAIIEKLRYKKFEVRKEYEVNHLPLHVLRDRIDQFKADTGVYPVELTDLTAPETHGTKAGKTTVPANSYKGPYLTPTGGINNTGIPKNRFVDMTAKEPDPALIATHWKYDPKTGKVEDATGKIPFDPRFESQ